MFVWRYIAQNIGYCLLVQVFSTR